MPWSHPSILRPHNNDPTPHQKENRGIRTLLQNPQNSINKFFFIPWEGKGEKSLKFKNISEVYKKKNFSSRCCNKHVCASKDLFSKIKTLVRPHADGYTLLTCPELLLSLFPNAEPPRERHSAVLLKRIFSNTLLRSVANKHVSWKRRWKWNQHVNITLVLYSKWDQKGDWLPAEVTNLGARHTCYSVPCTALNEEWTAFSLLPWVVCP